MSFDSKDLQNSARVAAERSAQEAIDNAFRAAIERPHHADSTRGGALEHSPAPKPAGSRGVASSSTGMGEPLPPSGDKFAGGLLAKGVVVDGFARLRKRLDHVLTKVAR